MKLAKLQKKLKSAGLDGYLVSRGNMFLGQDVLDEENQIQQLTGFTGSAGELIITKDKSYLFVDGRYELQAPAETDPDEVQVICGPNLLCWCENNLPKNKTFKLGCNPWCQSIEKTNHLQNINHLQLLFDDKFLPAQLTAKQAQVFEHKIEFCGIPASEKLTQTAQYLKEKKLDAFLFSAADSVSWLCNLRSNALPDTPVLRAYALVDKECRLWLFGENLSGISQIKFTPFDKLPQILHKFKHCSVGIDNSQTPIQIKNLIQKAGAVPICHKDSLQERKAVKNPAELNGIRNAHRRDATAMCKFLYWLENHWKNQTELDLVTKLHEFRAAGENYVSESFGTIAAFGSDGAVVHYHPDSNHNRPLQNGSLLLLDSGAQYYDGTTDITRTIAIGDPEVEMINDFTLVLKSHIALSSAVFPADTQGSALDALARAPLWAAGKDYNHGTGHGVGCFLNVHEGPFSIRKKTAAIPPQPGMVTSIEPGYYKENAYGIRIENLAEIITAPEPELKGYLKFANLTLVPIDKRLVNKYLLSDGEINWLNTYHRQVCETIAPLLSADEQIWLQEACAPL